MSKPVQTADILYDQRVCSLCGVFDGALDGRWSQALEDAETLLATRGQALVAEHGGFDPRSERNIATLILPAQKLARQFMALAKTFRLRVQIISGARTYAEQDALYAIGRTAELERRPVTNARGGQSNHNFGLAWDVGLFEADGRYMTGALAKDGTAYQELATFMKPRLPNLEWGGDWRSFPDAPHYQLKTGAASVAATRALFEAGRPLTA